MDSQLISLLTVVRIRLVVAGTAGSSTTSSSSSPSSSEEGSASGDDGALRLSFLDEVALRALGKREILRLAISATVPVPILAMILPSVARDFLRFSFATAASLLRAFRAALSTEVLAADAVTTAVDLPANLRFLAALRSSICLTSAIVSSEMSDPEEDELPVPSSPPESLSPLSLSTSLLPSLASSWVSSSRTLAFLAALVAARFAAFDGGGVAEPWQSPHESPYALQRKREKSCE